jgi:hypothetical protein
MLQTVFSKSMVLLRQWAAHGLTKVRPRASVCCTGIYLLFSQHAHHFDSF